MDLFFHPKICWKAVGRNLAFAIVKSGVFLTAPASFISAGDNNVFILAMLCSKLGKYYVYQNSDTTGAGDIMLNIQSLIKFPIPISSDKKYLIEKLIASSQGEPTPDIIQEIDNLIYAMYEFDSSEIEMIESV